MAAKPLAGRVAFQFHDHLDTRLDLVAFLPAPARLERDSADPMRCE
jgi:hypothetical protein